MEAMEGIAAGCATKTGNTSTSGGPTYHDIGNGDGLMGSPSRSPARGVAATSAKRAGTRSRSKKPTRMDHDIIKLLTEQKEENIRNEQKRTEDTAELKRILQMELSSVVTRVTKLEEDTKEIQVVQETMKTKQGEMETNIEARLTKLEQDSASGRMSSSAGTSFSMTSTQGSETKDPRLVEVRGWNRETGRTQIVTELGQAISGSGGSWTDVFAPFLFGTVGVIRCTNGQEAEKMITYFKENEHKVDGGAGKKMWASRPETRSEKKRRKEWKALVGAMINLVGPGNKIQTCKSSNRIYMGGDVLCQLSRDGQGVAWQLDNCIKASGDTSLTEEKLKHAWEGQGNVL